MSAPRTRSRVLPATILLAAALLAPTPAAAQHITTPKEHFGFNIGDDYALATYTQFEAYWQKLARESDRMVVQEIGRTAEGRPQLMAIVTSPENQARLEYYRQISRRLALGEGVSESEARALAREGKAVVWIDGGLHASEVLGAHQLIETVYRMVSMNDDETRRLLDDVIMLFVHANPDGMELVSNWYMREPDPKKRTTGGLPRLYHKYVGHDNNRDSYLVSQPETENMARILYIDWMPQIMYNHHQVGPAGAIMWAPPFRYPANYNIDPLVLTGIEQVGSAMQARFVYERKPGVTMRNGGPFSTWWNGGLRTTAYFHNIIGLLTETQGNPTPIQVPFVPSRILPNGDYMMPVTPQKWHFRQSVEYSVTANRAVLDYASRYREQLLLNMWRAATGQIEKGSQDHWTLTPKRIKALRKVLAENGAAERFAGPQTGALAGYFSLGVPTKYFSELRKPENRDPRGYVIPADQPDFPTATKFVNALLKNGVTVLRATDGFTVAGTAYPANSYVVKTAQAYRAHVLDMFEPQDHPNDFKYEGGPPIAPYDNAGYTLAFQMGVKFDRILDGFDGPFEKIHGRASPPPGRVADADRAAGFLVSHAVNDAAILTNRLLAAGHPVYWLGKEVREGGRTYPAGTIYVPKDGGSAEIVATAARELGIDARGTARAPDAGALRLHPVRIGLWDEYGGSIPSGWTRWLFEQFEFPYQVVYPKELDAGKLRDRFDVLVFVTDAIPERDGGGGDFAIFGQAPDTSSIPEKYRAWLGRVTVAETVPRLLEFMEQGGTIVAIGTSTAMARHAGLPLTDHLVDGEGRHLGPDQYYVPGSVLRVRVDNTRPLAFGLADRVDFFFNNSPVMRLEPAAPSAGVTPIAWFDSDTPLRSGWAWGQQRLNGGVAVAAARVGSGNLFLFGPEITNRGQPHGTFKFLFNGIYLAGAETRKTPVSAATPYVPPSGDAWETRAPEQVGMDPVLLQKAVDYALAHETTQIPEDPGEYLRARFRGIPYQDIVGPTKNRGGVNGIVLKDGYIVAEFGDTRRPDMTFSVTKSYLSTVAGLAWDDGLFQLDRPIGETVTDGTFASAHNAPITWHNLLQQTSEWEGTLWGKPDIADRREGVDRELHEPGTFWEYNDVRVNLMAYSLLWLFKRPLPEVLKERVMDPIGASDTWQWNGYTTSWTEIDGRRMQSVSGGGHWGGGFIINSRDHARFGLLALRHGRWGDRQLVSSEWFERATTPSRVKKDYGYMWWLNTDRELFSAAPASAFFALGAGSTSVIFVDREHDLVTVTRWVDGTPHVNEFIRLVLASIRG